MKYFLVPVIMAAAVGGTVGALKLIRRFFPESDQTIEKADEWIEKHK